MSNASIFNQFDLVVSITQKTINEQMQKLVESGTIRDNFIIWRNTDESSGNYTFGVVESISDIPKSVPGVSLVEYIDAKYSPSVSITTTGTVIAFDMNFQSGTAWLNNGFGTLVKHSTDSWIYSVNVQLGFSELAANDLKNKIKVPANVQQELEHFISSDFSVSHLFMDFESTNLLEPNSSTTTGKAGDKATDRFILFMRDYLVYAQKNGNPFLLGYSPVTTDKTKIDEDQQVPDVLRPVGNTYAMYYDAANPDLSNLNFMLVTKGGKGKIPSVTPVIPANWFTPADKDGAKMIYSHSVLVEPLILEPFFTSFQSGMYAAIERTIDTSPGNSYGAGKTTTPGAYVFSVQHDDGSHNKYFNSYSVTTSNEGGQILLSFTGHIHLYKKITKKIACKAEVGVTQNLDWNATVSVSLLPNAQKKMSLDIRTSMNPTGESHHTHKNKCAKFWEEVDKIIGKMFNELSHAVPVAKNAIDNIGRQTVSGGGSTVADAFEKVGNTVSSTMVLPAGSEFSFKSLLIHRDEAVSISMDYRERMKASGMVAEMASAS